MALALQLKQSLSAVQVAGRADDMDADGLEADHSNEAPWCDLDLFRKVSHDVEAAAASVVVVVVVVVVAFVFF